MNKFNSQLRDWERLQERLPGGPGDPMLDYDGVDEDRCRMEGEDVELENVHPVFQEILKQHFKRRKGLPGDFDVRPSDEQMEYFKRGGR